MHCLVCTSKSTRVIDSRFSEESMTIRRRRECEKCGYRFSTYEEIEVPDIIVVKENGKREAYSREKLEKGIHMSLTKRPYTTERFKRLIFTIEKDIRKLKSREITSHQIGEIVMKRLMSFDKVAYIRFASIYHAFEDVGTFENEIKQLGKKNKK